MGVIRAGLERSEIVSGGRQITGAVVNGIDRLAGDAIGGGLTFAGAGVEFSVDAFGEVSLSITIGTITSSTYSDGFSFGAAASPIQRENEISVLVPAGWSNAGDTLTMTIYATQPVADVPDVDTLSALGTGNNFTLRGRINDAGGLAITASGFFFREGTNSLSDLISFGTHLEDGTTSGVFFEDTGAVPYETNFTYVAYADNVVGRDYGSVVSFESGAQAFLLVDILEDIEITDAGLVTVTTNGSGRIDRLGALANGLIDVTSIGSNQYTAQLYGRSNRRIGRDVWIEYTITDSSAPNNGIQLGPVRQVATQEASLVNVTTASAHAVTATTATLRGAINDAIGVSADDAGFYWGLDTDFTGGGKITLTDTTGIIEADLTGLTMDTDYYFAAWGSNEHGEEQGATVMFTTNPITINPPEVTTGQATLVMSRAATLNGSATADVAFLEAAFFYGTDSDFGTFNFNLGTYPNAIKFDAKLPDPNIVEMITGLEPSTTYFFRAAASTAGGWDIGEEQTFTTTSGVTIRIRGEQFIDLHDSHNYSAVVTGSIQNPTYQWEIFDVVTTQDGGATLMGADTQDVILTPDTPGTIGLRLTVNGDNIEELVQETTLFIINTGGGAI